MTECVMASASMYPVIPIDSVGVPFPNTQMKVSLVCSILVILILHVVFVQNCYNLLLRCFHNSQYFVALKIRNLFG